MIFPISLDLRTELCFGVARPEISGSSNGTVNGRNPAPVDMETISLFTGFYTFQVVQDFFRIRLRRGVVRSY